MTHPEDNAAPVIRIARTGLFPFSARLGLFFAAYFVLIGVYTPFFPVWLAAKGLDAREIGIVLAAPMLVRFFVVPVVTRLADRGGALRPALILCAFATLAGYVAIWLSSGFVAILVAVSLMAVPYSPTMALGDAYALRGLQDRHAYGPVRMWGSISFIVASIGVGYLFDVMPAKDLILLIIGAVFATALSTLALPPLPPHAEESEAEVSATHLLRQHGFVAVLLAASLIQGSHSLYYGFSTISWKAAGIDGVTIGFLWSCGVVAEIVLFALSGRLPPAIGPLTLMGIGATAAVIRWTAMAFDPPGYILPALQAMHGISFGATHLGTIGYLANAAPRRLGATAQGYLYVVMSVVLALMLGVSGFLYSAFGEMGYLAMALVAMAGGVCVFVARPRPT
jgi:PPP family 3-phenylpropionic acid transporter